MKRFLIIAVGCLFLIVAASFGFFALKGGLKAFNRLANFVDEVKKAIAYADKDANMESGVGEGVHTNNSGIFDRILADFKNGKISSLEMSKACFYAAFYPEKKQKYKGELPGNRVVDMRQHLQRLADSYKNLGNDEKKKLEMVIFPEKYSKKMRLGLMKKLARFLGFQAEGCMRPREMTKSSFLSIIN